MKQKVLLGLFIIFIAQTAFSQNIAREEKDSTLVITTLAEFNSFPASFRHRIATSLSYGLNQKNNEELFWINFIIETCEYKFNLDKGAKARFTTFGGSTFSLTQEFSDLRQECEDRLFLKSRFNYYQVNPSYQMSKLELDTLMKEGVKSIDFVTTTGIVHFRFDKDAIGKTLQKEYDIVLANKSFDQDF